MREQVSDTVGGDWSKLSFLSGASKYGGASPVSQVMSCVTCVNLVSSVHDTLHGRHHYLCFTPEGKRLGQVMGIFQDHMALKWQGQVSNLFFSAELLILPLHFVASQAHVPSSKLPWRGEMLPWPHTHHATAKHSGAYPVQSVMDTDSCHLGFPSGLDGKESACSVGDPGSISALERSPREGTGNPLQYSCLENPMDRGAWRATVHGVIRVGHDLVTKPPHGGWIPLWLSRWVRPSLSACNCLSNWKSCILRNASDLGKPGWLVTLAFLHRPTLIACSVILTPSWTSSWDLVK